MSSSNTRKIIALTGGTGHLGNNLITALLESGFQVRALIRNPDRSFNMDSLEWITGDLNDLSALGELVKGCTAVIHCASVISLGEVDRETVYEVNVSGTQNLLTVCRDSSIRFIHISSSSAVLESEEGERFDENRPLRNDRSFYYAWTKAKSESLVLEEVKNKQLDALIIRPTAIIGPSDPEPSRFGRSVRDMRLGKMPFLVQGGYNLVDVRDLCRTIVNSIEMGQRGHTYLVGGEFFTLRDIAASANADKIPMIISLDLLLLLLPLIRIYDRIVGLRWPVTRESLTTIKFAPRNIDCSKAIAQLGHQSRPARESIEDLLGWFDKNNMI